MAVMNTGSIVSLLLPGLRSIIDTTKERPAVWRSVFQVLTSDKAYERDVEVKLFGPAQTFGEGESIAYEGAGERYNTLYRHVKLGLGFIITKQAIEDNLYKAQFNPSAQALKRSIRLAQEALAAGVLNNANDTTGTYYGGDGVALLSTAHPVDTGTYGNTPTVQAQLSETAITDAITAIGYYPDAAGNISMVAPEKIVIAPENQWVWQRLVGSVARVGTADNDSNVLRNGGPLANEAVVWPYLSNKSAWYILTDAEHGLKAYERKAVETDMFTDFDTGNIKTKAEWRGCFGFSNWRCTYGSMP